MKKNFTTTLVVIILLKSSVILAQTAVAPSAGDGSSGSPYEIATWQNLYWTSQNSAHWDKHYIQTANIGNNESFDLGNVLTIEAWVKPEVETGRQGIFSTRLNNSSGSFQLEIGSASGGTKRVAVSGVGTWVAQTGDDVYIDGQWTPIAYIRTGTGAGTHTIYVNGIAQTLISDDPYGFTNNTDNKVIGAGTSGSQFLSGIMDEVRIWNEARTEKQIQDNMHSTLTGYETGLVSYYQYNEGSGTTTYDNVSLNSGTLVNMGSNAFVASTAPVPFVSVADGVWANSANWLSGQGYPENAWARVEINSNISLEENMELIDLSINNGKSLTLSTGTALTATGDLVNEAGTSGLILQSDATGTASLIHSTDNVPATVNRYLTGNTVLTSKHYHQVSFPLNANTTSGEFLGSYLWEWDVTTQDFASLGSSTSTPVPNNQGYLVFYPDASVTYDFAGQLNNGTFDVPLGANNVDFTLAPNPYPSAINWNKGAGWTRSNLEGSYWIWSPLAGNYANYNGTIGTLGATEFIPAGQAFFVKANAGSPVMQLKNNARAHSNQAYLNTRQFNNMFRVTAKANNFKDEMVIYFDQEAENTVDSKDAGKLLGAEEAPQLYSFSVDSEKLSINVLPFAETTVIVPLGFEISENTESILYFDGVQTFDASVTIFLEDVLTFEMIDLRQQSQYIFQHNPVNEANRFKLHFIGVIGIDDAAAQSNYQIWSNNRKVYVNIPELNGHRAGIEMFDVLGSRLYSSEGVLNSPAVIRAMNIGVAIVRVSSADRVYTTKLYIQ